MNTHIHHFEKTLGDRKIQTNRRNNTDKYRKSNYRNIVVVNSLNVFEDYFLAFLLCLDCDR